MRSRDIRFMRLAVLVAIAGAYFVAWSCAEASGQQLHPEFVAGGGSCVVVKPPEFGNGQNNSQSVSWRVDPLDSSTIRDLFGSQFNRKFLTYRICLLRITSVPGTQNPLYLVQDFLRIPVEIRSADGRALTTTQLKAVLSQPLADNLGFSAYDAPPGVRTDCNKANALYRPLTSDDLLERNYLFTFRGVDISKSNVVRLNGVQRRNVRLFVLKPFEKLYRNQHIERVIVIPEEESIGKQTVRIAPCLKHIQFGLLY